MVDEQVRVAVAVHGPVDVPAHLDDLLTVGGLHGDLRERVVVAAVQIRLADHQVGVRTVVRSGLGGDRVEEVDRVVVGQRRAALRRRRWLDRGGVRPDGAGPPVGALGSPLGSRNGRSAGVARRRVGANVGYLLAGRSGPGAGELLRLGSPRERVRRRRGVVRLGHGGRRRRRLVVGVRVEDGDDSDRADYGGGEAGG